MSYPSYGPDAGGPNRLVVNVGTLWAGGLAAGVVAALAYVLGVIIARGILNIPVLAPTTAGTFGDGSTWSLAAAAFIAAILATALMNLLLVATPRPFSFFGWIIGLLTALVTALPFMQDALLKAQVATAIINLVVGCVIGTLISGVARRAVRPAPVVRRPPPGSASGYPPGSASGYPPPGSASGYPPGPTGSGYPGPAGYSEPGTYPEPNPAPPPRGPYESPPR